MDEKCVCHSRYNHALFDQSTFLCARTQRGILGAKTLLRGRIAESFECGNPREILETDVSANESIWRTSRRQGEAQYYTPHPLPPSSCSSPLPPPPPFPPLTSWFLCFLRHRRRNDFLPSWPTLVADSAILDPSRAKLHTLRLLSLPPGWLRSGRWQHPYRYPSTRILTATGCWSIILGVRIFR